MPFSARQRLLGTTGSAARRRIAVLGTVVAVAAGLVPALSTPARAATTRDGLSEATALASCWDVKQVNPAAADGRYWLYTPGLGYPQQFWCDMTTDGGGWVLLGRGRENWSFLPEGQGTTAEVSATVTGTAAFAPKAVPTATVNGLLNGTAVKDLTDGVRVRRATNTAGTTWQEARVFPSTMGEWRWTIGGGYPLSRITFGATTYTNTATGSAIWSSAYTFARSCPTTGVNCLDTRRVAAQNNNLPGFGYGSAVAGTASTSAAAATSYLWSYATGYAMPFAQVFVRPKVRWADLAITPVGTGLAGSTKRSMFDNFAETQPAGVSGQANGLSTERDTEVRAFAQIGSTMYVGGNFAQVDEYGATTTSTPQAYLAAFDVSTGAWVPGFRPTLNGKVNALTALPNGTLAVGGEFTTVNGVAQAGLVALDPATGATSAAYRFALERRSTSGTTTTITPGTVTGLSLQGTWLYAGGQFTHTAGGTTALSGFSYTKRGARFSLTTGRPDSTWNPAFDGTPVFVLASAAGDRVYFGGFMATMNDGAKAVPQFAAVTTTSPAAAVAGLKARVSSAPAKATYQQTAVETGSRFILGGSEHSFHSYDRADMTMTRGNVSNANPGGGGDFQAATVDQGIAYGSCHCILSYNYGGRTLWSSIDAYDDIDNIRYIGAYDVATGKYLTDYTPWIKTRAVRGPWALTVDSDNCLWQGGDTTQTKRRSDSTWQSSGGFSRFCRNDSEAPTVPTAVKSVAAVDGSTVTVSWTGSTDNRAGGLRYTVFRGDVPIATTTSWKIVVPAADAPGSYVVRALDKAGNVSATTAPLVVG
ncbi:fibrinogen-like YCDxxxxGGGW domain-containing protein [Kineosporia sp. A_224]|uniref:fibrinogen-like YCDxxxxGGGW domain-containing protein n=1 Tax=Kineosporia sp. A_224 TaxID=1962180 RepID=UPI00117B5416|nr:fibrinogen-like YCDxxxxGGGW domain-containing protein [Kineosporia sp. A_224]